MDNPFKGVTSFVAAHPLAVGVGVVVVGLGLVLLARSSSASNSPPGVQVTSGGTSGAVDSSTQLELAKLNYNANVQTSANALAAVTNQYASQVAINHDDDQLLLGKYTLDATTAQYIASVNANRDVSVTTLQSQATLGTAAIAEAINAANNAVTIHTIDTNAAVVANNNQTAITKSEIENNVNNVSNFAGLIQTDYQQFLHRSATPNEIAFQSGAITGGAYGQDLSKISSLFAQSVAQSPEAAAWIASHPTQG